MAAIISPKKLFGASSLYMNKGNVRNKWERERERECELYELQSNKEEKRIREKEKEKRNKIENEKLWIEKKNQKHSKPNQPPTLPLSFFSYFLS